MHAPSPPLSPSPRDEIPIELGARETFAELWYLIRRARRLWPRVVGTAVAIALLFALSRSIKPSMHTSTVVLRLQAGEGDAGTRPSLARDLRIHVGEVIFNKRALRAVADEYKLQSALFAKNPEVAFENLRDLIEIDVWQNYFLDDNIDTTPTARLAISFSDPSADTALAVARALAATYIETEQRERQRVSEEALGANEELVEEANDALAVIDARLSAARRNLSVSPARALLELGDLQRQRNSAELAVHALERRRTELNVQLGFERNKLGLNVEVVEAGRAQAERIARPLRLASLTLVVFALALFASAILYGSFDERVRDARDLRMIGMPLLGTLPRPAVTVRDVGSLDDRLARDDAKG